MLAISRLPVIFRKVLGIGKDFSIVESDLEFCVFAMEVVRQALQIAAALPLAHGEVVEQVVSAGFRSGGWHLRLGENPLQALDGECAYGLNGVITCHNDVHACEAAHRTDINHVVLGGGVAEPCCHQMLDAVDGSRGDGWFFVWLGDAQVEGGEAFVLARHVDAWLQVGVVNCETLYDFHNFLLNRVSNQMV